MVNISNLKIRPNTIKNIHRLVDTYRIKLNGDLPTLTVKIFQNAENKFYAIPNYFISTDSIKAHGYVPKYYESEESALNETVSFGLSQFKPDSTEHRIERNELYYEDLNIDIYESSF